MSAAESLTAGLAALPRESGRQKGLAAGAGLAAPTSQPIGHGQTEAILHDCERAWHHLHRGSPWISF